MLSSTVPRLAGAGLVLLLGWGLAELVGRGVTLLLGPAEHEQPVRRGAVALVRLLTLMVVLDLLGRLVPVSVGLAMLIVGWLALRPGRPSRTPQPARWSGPAADRAATEASMPVRAEAGRPVRSAYDRRRLARPGPDRRGADGTRAAS